MEENNLNERSLDTKEEILLMDKDNETSKVEVEYDLTTPETLLYKVTDTPPVYMSIFFALQQALLSLSGSLAISTFVADVACASDFPDIKTDLLSSTMFMNGVTTLLQVTLGIRLPLFQGATPVYVIPLLALQRLNSNFCTVPGSSISVTNETMYNFEALNMTSHFDMESKRRFAFYRLREFQGSLILVGLVHCFVGLTGTVGFLMRFIGPVTIVPTILVGGIFISRSSSKFAKAHWGISAVTAITSIILSLYLSKLNMPCPAWSKKKGFHIYWYPLHRVFAILIGMLVGWTMAAIMTHAGALTDNPKDPQYLARTDARAGIIKNATWFRVPYPNQFGTPYVNVGFFVAFLIGTIVSILDSIGDYNACARTCNVPPPAAHGINRGIAVEGICSAISGAIGCGHATSTIGANIGAVGVTRVASRNVFVWVGVIYMIFGVVGKVSAVFITMPYPVLGGAMIIMYGMFNGIILSNLHAVSLSSTRNVAIIGIAILVGLMIPYWLEKNPGDIDTGDAYRDSIIKNLMANPNLCCGILACFLDNTVPGTIEERGIAGWLKPDRAKTFQYSEGVEVYQPLLPRKWLSHKIMRYIPFCPFQPRTSDNSYPIVDTQSVHEKE
ncbi:solute carrier family 23 member 1-like [Pecten maximus]|uniref:solute carrier family 23 member 1-like n=1 Tax=Pecten maximus TaxID=6579 RepID=UPI001457FB24|nr:solute carrier family 23 member 1-like [Pecten maximus]